MSLTIGPIDSGLVKFGVMPGGGSAEGSWSRRAGGILSKAVNVAISTKYRRECVAILR